MKRTIAFVLLLATWGAACGGVRLEALGLIVVTTSEPSDVAAAGLVASQDPAGGTVVDLGSSVTIVLSV